VCPVLGDYLYEDNVARHNTHQVAADLLELSITAQVSAKGSVQQ